MKIEIWSDFTCPYCYIGKRNLELAIEQFEHDVYIEIEYKSFELDPEADCHSDQTKRQMLMEKYGMSEEKLNTMIEGIMQQAEEVGLEIHFDRIVHTNTFHAHRLVKYAYKNGKETSLIDQLFKTYFYDNKNIGARAVLLQLAQEVGLDAAETDELLCLNKYSKAVHNDQQLAQEIGVTGVPFFIFNEKYALSGAQPARVFKDVLVEILKEEKETVEIRAKKTTCEKSYCTGNDCEAE